MRAAGERRLQGAAADVCALKLGFWCHCRAPLPDVWPGVLWAGAAAGRRCQMCGWVCFGLVLWQGAAARCVAVKF